ncbi:twin-arginine translocation signal domain-containing protein [Halorussus gelatinilyticus]|uniref:Twin-arginine translocation signal domain-containing protein n=1 Tax=Halorussus gelatinilyticus TaxID=2937524 RepID=A0A8U0IMK1_9EURY|nr:twin-arginine translocation signal domain-containing protein [Halorussus gelatinilyticus]UPW01652.1 twin-arginine translocation signal domain-containing protein [Halorussus gelatinilyticus]
MGDDSKLYDTVAQARDDVPSGPSMSRRDVLKTGAMATAMAAGGPAAVNHVAPRYSPIGRADALAGVIAGAAVAAAAGAAVHWYVSGGLDGDSEDETLTQTHRNIRSAARGLDSSAEAEQEFENLVANRSSNWIWQDAVLEFVRGFNDTSDDAPSIPDLKAEMEANIRDDYADLEQQIVDNQTTDVVQLIEMFNHVHSYGHADSAGQIFNFYYTYNTGVDSSEFDWVGGHPVGDVSGYDVSNSDDVLRPFSDYYGDDPVTSTDDIIYIDYETINGETMEAAAGWGDYTFMQGSGFGGGHYYYDSANDDFTSIQVETDSYTGGMPQRWGVTDPDGSDLYGFLDLQRRRSAVSNIRSAAQNLAGEVDSWVDQIDQNYARGSLPAADVVATSRLWEEYSYEEGNASLTALSASQLGFETDLKGTATVVEYPNATSKSEIDGMDGQKIDGNLLLDTPDEVSVNSGEAYVVDNLTGSDGAVLMTTPSGDTAELEGVFEVKALYSYEDGERVEKDTMTPETYTFSPRDPNQYEEDVEQANNAREAATQNPEINVSDLFGLGGAGAVFNDIPRWAFLVPGAGLIIALFAALAGGE